MCEGGNTICPWKQPTCVAFVRKRDDVFPEVRQFYSCWQKKNIGSSFPIFTRYGCYEWNITVVSYLIWMSINISTNTAPGVTWTLAIPQPPSILRLIDRVTRGASRLDIRRCLLNGGTGSYILYLSTVSDLTRRARPSMRATPLCPRAGEVWPNYKFVRVHASVRHDA
jgi:hypothetical protein